MFLITAESLKREASLHSALSSTLGVRQDPEEDAIRASKRLGKFFLHGTNVPAHDYAVESSAKTKDSSGELLRSIGAATHQMSNLKGGVGPRAGGEWLIDGLARNLLRPLFINVRISTAPASALNRLTKEVSFSELLAQIGSSARWKPASARTIIREREYRIRGDGIDERLIFIGHPFVLSSATGMISGLKLSGRGRPRSLAGGNLKRAINAIFEDQNRRLNLSYEYDRAPEAKGLPAPLRAEVKRALEAVGIPNGSYSREGFSSGKFPYRFTHTAISGSASRLIFDRCSLCRDVKALAIENGSFDQLRAVWELTENHIGPWHSRSCGSARYTTATKSALSFKTQPWELKWLGAGILN